MKAGGTLQVICMILASLMLGSGAGTVAAHPGSPSAESLQGATWIEMGNGHHQVYVFTDPNCPYCADLYRTLKGLSAQHDLRVRWLPVAVVDATSLGKAAAWLQSEDPLATLDLSKRGFQPGLGGHVHEDVPSTETERNLEENHRLLALWAIPVVPTMVVMDRDGVPRVFQGSLSPLALGRIFDHLH